MKSVITDEIERLKNLIGHYNQELKTIPKGTIVKKKISGNDYAYKVFRDAQGKVCTEYIGKPGSEEVAELDKKIKQRQKIEKLLKQAQKNYNEVIKLEKALPND